MAQQVKVKNRLRFNEKDYELLIELISHHRDTIMDRRQDYGSLEKRRKVWSDVTTAFNAGRPFDRHASSDQVKKLWDNLQTKSKNKIAKEKQERRLTGGGTIEVESNDFDQKVAAIIGNELKPYDNPFDSDANHHGDDIIKLDDVIKIDNEIEGKMDKDAIKLDQSPLPAIKNRKTRPLQNTQSTEAQELLIQKLKLEIEVLQLKKEVYEEKKVILALKKLTLSNETIKFDIEETDENNFNSDFM